MGLLFVTGDFVPGAFDSVPVKQYLSTDLFQMVKKRVTTKCEVRLGIFCFINPIE